MEINDVGLSWVYHAALSTALLMLLVCAMNGHYILENPHGSFMFDYVYMRKVWRILKKACVKVGLVKT